MKYCIYMCCCTDKWAETKLQPLAHCLAVKHQKRPQASEIKICSLSRETVCHLMADLFLHVFFRPGGQTLPPDFQKTTKMPF